MSDKGYVSTGRRRRQRERRNLAAGGKNGAGWITTPINYYRRQILALE
jgi:hypothetical protein